MNHMFVLYEYGKFVGVFTQVGLDTYISSIGMPISWATDWKFDANTPYQKTMEGFEKNRTTPVIRIVKVIVDALTL